MKHLLLTSLCGAALILTGCSDDTGFADGNTGSLRLNLGVDRGVVSATQSRATLDELMATVTEGDFTIRLTNEDGEAKEWAFTDYTGENIQIGTYKVEAYAGTEGKEGFDAPYFYAVDNVTVTTGNTSTVTLEAGLANAAVRVNYTEAFRNYLSNYSASVRTAGSADGIDYPANTTDDLFVNAGEASLYVSFANPQGQTATVKAAKFTAEARHRYTVTVDVNGGEMGAPTLTVEFDDATVAETREFTLSDELFNAPAPTVTPATASFDVIEGSVVDDAKVNIIARGKLAAVRLTTVSSSLILRGWPAEIDLMAATDGQRQQLEALGLQTRGLWNNPDQMAVVDLSHVIANIHPAAGSADNVNTFRIEVEDEIGKVSDPAGVIEVTVNPVTLAITGQEMSLVGTSEAVIKVAYNGGSLDDAKFEVYHVASGMWDEVRPIKIAPASRAEVPVYDVTLPVDPNAQEVKVRLTIGNLAPVSYTINRGAPEYAVAVSNDDAYATYAYVAVSSDEVDPASLIPNLSFKATVGSAAVSGIKAERVAGADNKVKVSGLPANSEVAVTASFHDKSKTATFHTEEARQIPNGNLDAAVTNDGSDKYWENVVFEGWGTNNPMTTSQGSGYGYVRISGTKQTSDSHSGSAARIATQGWGSGNTALGSSATSGKCKYIDAGLLHLGSSRTTRPVGYSGTPGSLNTDDLDCGIAFASRPASLSFWFKYEPKSSDDRGEALAEIYDADGNKLGGGRIELASTSTYTERTINFDYAPGAKKAAKIYVRFLSTIKENAVNRNNGWLTGPGFSNLSRGEFAGAALFIDEVKLNY